MQLRVWPGIHPRLELLGFAVALGGLGAFLPACAGARARGMELAVPEPPMPVNDVPLEVVPYARGPNVNLATVKWTAPRDETVARLAERWGFTTKTFIALNPELRTRKEVEAGERWVVYRAPKTPAVSRSIGSPNRGRVEHAVAFPEGGGWQLRPWRHRAYGTKQLVEHLAGVLFEFSVSYPDAAPLLIGDIGNRRGGRAPPHRSHQSGRDVDLGYVVAQDPATNGRWARVKLSEFDAERNWALMRMMIATGVVDHIFVDGRMQKPLLEAAKADLPPEELGRYFAIAAEGRRAQAAAYISHWKGHDDHMHVRFRCAEVDVRCASVPQKRKSTSKSKSASKNKSKRKPPSS